jgi:hypothetical protein
MVIPVTVTRITTCQLLQVYLRLNIIEVNNLLSASGLLELIKTSDILLCRYSLIINFQINIWKSNSSYNSHIVRITSCIL